MANPMIPRERAEYSAIVDRPPLKFDLQRLAKAQVAARPTPDHLRYGVNPA